MRTIIGLKPANGYDARNVIMARMRTCNLTLPAQVKVGEGCVHFADMMWLVDNFIFA